MCPWRSAFIVHLISKLAALPGALRRVLNDHMSEEMERRNLGHVLFATGVIVRGGVNIKAGRGVFLDHRSYLNCNGPDGFITLGDNVEVGPYTVLWGGGGVTIGNDVHIGTHVHITSMEGNQIQPNQTDPFAPLSITRAPVTIGDHVLIYSHAVIIPGVTVGHHSAIAAGAVVTEDVPPYALVAGVPARIVRYTHQENGAEKQNLTVGSN
jgi:acetyltransferase-like isoleucine patch superfamily enzyme